MFMRIFYVKIRMNAHEYVFGFSDTSGKIRCFQERGLIKFTYISMRFSRKRLGGYVEQTCFLYSYTEQTYTLQCRGELCPFPGQNRVFHS